MLKTYGRLPEETRREEIDEMAGSNKGGANQKKAAEKGKGASKPQRKAGELTRFQKIVIIIFIVIFAGSTLAGALASVVQSQQYEEQNQELTAEKMDQTYQDVVADLEAKLEESPDDLDTLVSLGQYCYSWGSGVLMLATDDADTTHGVELLEKAIGYYDRALEIEDAPEVRVNRALCLFYEGRTDDAATALQETTTTFPDYAAGWQGLGAVYESQGKTEDAIAAYEKAIELDPDDEAGVKSVSEGRLEQLQGTDDAGADEDAATDDDASADATTTDDEAAGDASND